MLCTASRQDSQKTCNRHHPRLCLCLCQQCGTSSILQRCRGIIAAAACREFGETGPFWGRQYFFWHNDKPLTLIYEVFSPALQRLLGPALLQR